MIVDLISSDDDSRLGKAVGNGSPSYSQASSDILGANTYYPNDKTVTFLLDGWVGGRSPDAGLYDSPEEYHAAVHVYFLARHPGRQASNSVVVEY